MKIFGVVPARMASSRFPGKPLALIFGRPMVEHVMCRAQLFQNWDGLFLATCDEEIADFGRQKNYEVIMTSDKHTRCLDRVAEAIENSGVSIADSDIVVCVQGDEPMLSPEMIDAAIKPVLEHEDVNATVLGMEVIDDEMFRKPDVVKLVHDMKGDVLYTSRSPIPYCKKLTPEVGAIRIYGIFAFRWAFLKKFNSLSESPLELVESCDSNRIMDNGYKQRLAKFPYKDSFAVDIPEDLTLVEQYMKQDPLWKMY